MNKAANMSEVSPVKDRDLRSMKMVEIIWLKGPIYMIKLYVISRNKNGEGYNGMFFH